MDTKFFLQKYIVGMVFLVLVAGGFLFRDQISELLRFGDETSPVVYKNPPRPRKDSPTPIEVPKAPSNTMSFQYAPLMKYVGRDPEEVRPVPEEVKLFSDSQRQELYATMQTHGRSVKKDPEYFSGWIQVGLLKKIIGDFEGARDAWEYAGIIQPLNSVSFSNLGELYWRYLHEYPKSEASFKTAIKNKSFDTQNYVSLAELYHYSYKEKYDLAPSALLDGLKTIPDDETLMRRLAYLYEQRGEPANALLWWEKVLTKSPGDAEVGSKVEKLREKLKK